MTIRLTIIVNIGLLLCLTGCYLLPNYPVLPPKKRNGITYGILSENKRFRHEFWHYYEQGLSFADGQFYDDALICLKEALRQNPKDNFRTLSYGRHFWHSYFPNREIGIIYYKFKQLDLSITYLENSLDMYPTNKAKLYLDRARKAWLIQNQLDHAKPIISVIPSMNHAITNSLTYTIKGVASDDTFVKEISINGQSYPIDLSKQKLSFEYDVTVATGENPFNITCTDLIGNTSSPTHITIICDTNSPMISIDPVIKKNECLELNGFISDNHAIQHIEINHDKYDCPPNKTMFPITVSVRYQPNMNNIPITATDTAGNSRTVYIDITTQPQQPDHEDPMIKINHPHQTTHLSTALIEAFIQDNQGIKDIRINQKALAYVPSCKHLYFSQLVTLHHGDNLFTIVAKDQADNQISEQCTIQRVDLFVKQVGSRLRMVVSEFTPSIIGQRAQLTQGIQSIMHQTIKNEKRFLAIDRSQKDQSNASNYLSLGSKCLLFGFITEREASKDQSNASDHLSLGSECFLLGFITEREASTEIHVELVDTETKEHIYSTDIYDEAFQLMNSSKQVDQVNLWLHDLTQKIHHELAYHLPLMNGTIQAMKDNTLFQIDIGSDHRLKKGMVLIIYDIATNSGLTTYTDTKEILIGEAKIETVNSTQALARITKKFKQTITAGQYVITK